MCLDSRDTPDAVGCRALLVSQIHDQVDLVVGLYKQLFLLSLALSFIRAALSSRVFAFVVVIAHGQALQMAARESTRGVGAAATIPPCWVEKCAARE
ncbi:hypothetical protein [Stenotrophomonas sp.]|uniref:hypothetical protein n=1 Tax=Stenotrophomonas sp. TaxID=69392 RepID=UPI0028A86619|nr:hypothetical protein [Stenotrophomonas sp.]